MGFVYLLLLAGAVTTVYPFLMMGSTGMKGPTDQNDNRIVPAYFKQLESKDEAGKLDPASLLGKYLDDKYSGNSSLVASSRLGGDAGPDEIAMYERYLMGLDLNHWIAGFRTAPNQVTSRLSMRYQNWLRGRYGTIERLNLEYIEENVAFQGIAPPNELLDRKTWVPPKGKKYTDWLEFKAALPAEYRIPIRAERLYQEYLRGKHQNQIAEVPAEVKGEAATFETIRADKASRDYREFEQSRLPSWLAGDPAVTRWESISNQPMPIAAYETAFVRDNAGPIRREFATRNTRYILDYILLHGRAVWNTILFCLLTIAVQLVVNPLAAYALSRYPIRASGKILIFLLATMAFPAEVAMIPSFLLLKDLGLLNTFAALVLPAAASGYMIFLLKGFFDSLPQELYESGQIDGAKESTMMFKIAFPLSRPVLGYLALLAFMGAYGAFLYAFLVAQDQRMWTLMVFIYQLQQVAPKAVIMAALTLAAVPTLIVFLLAQKVILRGIVLPGER